MSLNKKKCVFNNYIPHKVPKFMSKLSEKNHYNVWFECYKNNLIEMYSIFYKNISKRYEQSELKFDNTIFYSNKYHDNIFDDKIFEDVIFKRFCMMIYNSSSKHIDDLKI